MREIEFRGKRVDNGKYVYGDLIHMTGGRVGIIFDKRVAAVEVKPNSVAQLVGHDANGKKVYEDDILLDDDEFISNEWQAHLTWQVTDKDCADIECFYNLDELKLKEATL